MGIRGKLTLPVLLAFLVFAGILHFYWEPQQLDNTRETFVEQTRKELAAMESDTIRNLLANDYAALFASLDAQAKRNSASWVSLTLYNEKNKRVYPLFPPRSVLGENEFRIPLKHKLLLEGESLGYLEVHLDWYKARNSALQRIEELEWFLIGTAFLVLLFTLIWQNQVIRLPILRLQKAAMKMTEGDFSSPLPDVGKDEVGKLTSLFNDMRTNILSNQQLQSSKLEALSTLSGGIAHEFNNILAVILGNADLAMGYLSGDDGAKRHLKNITKAGERAAGLVSQILTFSRMDTSNFQTLNLSLVVLDALQAVESTISDNIEIIQSVPVNISNICADEIQLHQIILNLCANASHAMRKTGGTLTVTVEEITNRTAVAGPANCINLTVKDTGQGFDETVKQHIFDPFYTTKEVGEGSGLGLAVVYGIVDKHKGEITVTSSVGQGASFSIFFPVVESETRETAANRSAPTIAGAGDGQTRIPHLLIVEDDPSLVGVYRDLFEGRGFTVTTCNNGLYALDKFIDNPDQYDIVLTDHDMPEMTGKQLIPQLLDVRPDVPIIFLTGYIELMDEKEAAELKITEYLVKPVQLETLLQTVEKCLNKEISRVR